MTTTSARRERERRQGGTPWVTFGPYDGLTTNDMFKPGFNLGLPRFLDSVRNERWYTGDYNDLWRNAAPNLVNGLSLVPYEDIIRLPVFEVGSKYYQDALYGRHAILEGHNAQGEVDEPLQTWIDERRRDIWRAQLDAAEHWSINGRFILTAWEGESGMPERLKGERGSNHLFITDEQDIDLIRGHCIFYRWYDPGRATEGAERSQVPGQHIYRQPNMLTEHRWMIGEQYAQMYQYELAGLQIGKEVMRGRSALRGVFVAGNRRGWYESAQDVVAAICTRVTLLQRASNRDSDRHLFIPTDAVNVTIQPPTPMPSIDDPNPEPPPPTTLVESPGIRNSLREGRAHVIEADSMTTGTGWGYFEYDPRTESNLEFIRWFLDFIFVLTGVSPTSYGGAYVGRSQSGESIRQARSRSSQLIAELRGEVEFIVPQALALVGAPIPDGLLPEQAIAFVWGGDPFEDTDSIVATMKMLLDMEAIVPSEVRAAAGFPSFTPEQREEIERKYQQQQQEQQAGMMQRMVQRVTGRGGNGNENQRGPDN